MLVAFEAAVGLLILSGGRRTQYGYVGVIGFYLALWLFGGFQLGWSVAMLPFMFLLWRAERIASTPSEPGAVEHRVLAGVGS